MTGDRYYLVTGGAGFLGAHLCQRLLQDGCSVLCLDNLSTGRLQNIVQYRHDATFRFIEHDVSAVREFGSLAGLAGIFHLACPASPLHYQADPIQTTRTAVLGTLNMLELARQHGIPMVHASTSEVYGSPVAHPQQESDWGRVNPNGPRACYDEGKRCAESLCFDYHRRHGVAVKVARIFNTYGPGMRPDDGRVVSNFIRQALQDQPLTVYGDGQQTRSLCYVDDLIEGLVRFMRAPGHVTGPINLGNPNELSIRRLANLVREVTGASAALRFLTLPVDDPPRRCPDIGLARELLGWQPRIDLREGLQQTVSASRAALARSA